MSNTIELSGIFSEGYGFVPKKLMKAKDIKSNTKLLLCYLLSYTGAGMECFPSIDTITNDLGISKRTAISCIKEAVSKEYISKRQIQRGQGIGKQNIYTLLFMHTFPSANNASANIARAKKDIASANNDNLQVQNSTSNNNSINNNNNNNKRTVFKKPSIQEIQEYLKEKNITCVDAEKFYYHYESTGWMRGKNKIKSWKACIRTWVSNHKSWNSDDNKNVNDWQFRVATQWTDDPGRRDRIAAYLRENKYREDGIQDYKRFVLSEVK